MTKTLDDVGEAIGKVGERFDAMVKRRRSDAANKPKGPAGEIFHLMLNRRKLKPQEAARQLIEELKKKGCDAPVFSGSSRDDFATWAEQVVSKCGAADAISAGLNTSRGDEQLWRHGRRDAVRRSTPKSFWSYQAGSETPSLREAIECGAIGKDTTERDWDRFSLGMKREIVRTAKKMKRSDGYLSSEPVPTDKTLHRTDK
jgi:hypothetical protein